MKLTRKMKMEKLVFTAYFYSTVSKVNTAKERKEPTYLDDSFDAPVGEISDIRNHWIVRTGLGGLLSAYSDRLEFLCLD